MNSIKSSPFQQSIIIHRRDRPSIHFLTYPGQCGHLEKVGNGPWQEMLTHGSTVAGQLDNDCALENQWHSADDGQRTVSILLEVPCPKGRHGDGARKENREKRQTSPGIQSVDLFMNSYETPPQTTSLGQIFWALKYMVGKKMAGRKG